MGIPYNIASYAILTRMFAQVTNMAPGELIWMGGDVHLYSNHLEQVEKQLSREPFRSPVLKLNPNITNLFDFKANDIKLDAYEAHDSIKGDVAV